MIRLYIAPSPDFASGVIFALPLDQGRYLAAVMRQGVGDVVAVFNGRDGEWTARLVEAGKKTVRLELIEQTRPQTAPQELTLAIALVKRAALETIVEKATELGASAIQPVISNRSNTSHTNIDRLWLIAREAAEQTERLDIPAVLHPVKLDKWLADADFSVLVFPDEDTTHEIGQTDCKSMLAALDGVEPGPAPAILIGPEGGFDDGERAALRAMDRVYRVNLGPRILRADTAAIAALALYQAKLGDWR